MTAEQAGRGTDTAAQLLREKEQLERALMAGYACQREDAWEILMIVSQHANIKLRGVATVRTWQTRQKRSPRS